MVEGFDVTGQNRSSAVMQQRREAHDSLDDFPTPPWATRALCHWITEQHIGLRPLAAMTVREPAANRGHMARPLAECFLRAEVSDIHDYGAGFPVRDYLFGPPPDLVDWTITNPPFRLAQQFIVRGLISSERGVAVIVRSAFLEGQERYRELFSVQPPTDILQFTERVVMHRGKLSANGSSATAYCWLVWRLDPVGGPWSGRGGTVFHWIPPCRKQLERPSDYAGYDETKGSLGNEGDDGFL